MILEPRTGASSDRTVPRRWARGELTLVGVLLALSAVAWLATDRLATPDMRVGILTGTSTMVGPMRPWPAEVVLFLATWVVMMAAMMLPAIAPFTVGMTRLLRTGGAGRTSTLALTTGYFLVWAGTGVLAYLVLRGFGMVPGDSGTVSRVGGLVLLAAGIYQLTPLKRRCLRHCRSPVLLVLRHGRTALRGPGGALRIGIGHGGYCLGCCWALMAVLLAVGAMSLVWMGAVAALVALEKAHRYGEPISRVLGGMLIGVALVVLIRPELLAVVG